MRVRATTHERSKRVHRDKNNKVPMTSRTPRLHSCPSSCFGIQLCARAESVQLPLLPRHPVFIQQTRSASHNLLVEGVPAHASRITPNDVFDCAGSMAWNCIRITFPKQAFVVVAPHPDHSRPAYVVMMAHRELFPCKSVGSVLLSPSLFFDTRRCAEVLPRPYQLPPEVRCSPSHLLSVDNCLSPHGTPQSSSVVPIAPQDCRAGASGTVSHPFMINQPAKLMMKSRTDSAKP